MHLASSRGRSLQWQFITGLMLALLAGCSSAPKSSSSAPAPRSGAAPAWERDGPDAQPPPDLANVPDAEPRVEAIRPKGPNKPYEMRGREYVPLTEDRPYTERGMASWYGRKFHGRRTANGEVYNMYAMTAAHPTLPLPSYARVFNPANRREVVVRVNDRGPFHAGRIIDLSYAAAHKLGVLRRVSPVEVTRITFDEIRSGSWRRGGDGEATVAVAAAGETASTGAGLATVVPVAQQVSARLDDAATPAPAVPVGGATDAAQASARLAPGFWVQLGVFKLRDGAESFQRRVAFELDWLAPLLGVFDEPKSFRLQAGPYARRDEADEVARRVREALQLVPVIVERR
jgi:rare lipoprotein A